MIEYEFLESFCQEVLSDSPSVRWVGIANHNGVILAQRTRNATVLLLTHEENEEYAETAIARQKTRNKFEPKIGKLLYAFGKYQKLLRATVPINEKLFLLLTFDATESNFDLIISEKIMARIERESERFFRMIID